MRHRSLSPLVVAASIASVAPSASVASGQVAFDFPIITQLPAGFGPTAVRLADLDGDGVLDAVVTGRNYIADPEVLGRIAVLKGLGNGSFQPWPDVIVSKAQGEDLVLADFDGDGQVDLAATLSARRGRVYVAFGQGDGTFGPGAEVDLERQPRGVAAADLDGDGDIDLAAVNYGSASLMVLENRQGQFSLAATRRLHPYVGAIPFPSPVRAADLTGDGRIELVTAATGAGRMAVAAGSSDPGSDSIEPGRLVDWRPEPPGGESPGVIGVSIADFDGDGSPDVAMPVLLTSQTQKVVLFRNDGSAGFTQQSVVDTGSLQLTWSSTPIDFDGDGKPDLAVGTALSGSIIFLRNTTAGPGGPITFAIEPIFMPYGIFVRDLVAGDVDGDGDQDLVGVEIAGSTLFVLKNRTGEGGVAAMPRGRRDELPVPERSVTADRNGDEVLDAADLAIELEAFRSSSGSTSPTGAGR